MCLWWSTLSNTQRDLEWIREHSEGFDVVIEDQTQELAMLALQGPKSEAALQKMVSDLDLSSIGYYKSGFGTLAGMPEVRISRTGYTGEDGFEIYFPDGESERIWNLLLEQGRPEGLVPIGLGARDTLRLEAGMPLFGHELGEGMNPIEAGLNFAVSFHADKGDYIGRDALARTKENPTKRLMGFTTDGKRVPREGYGIFHGDQQVAHVCSGAISPTLNTNIGTCYLPTEIASAGTSIEMDIRGKRQAAVVTEIPFYSRKK